MYISIQAFDKNGNQILGNCNGQAYFEAEDYIRTLRYKQVKKGVFAQGKVVEYRVYKSIDKYSNEETLLEIIKI